MKFKNFITKFKSRLVDLYGKNKKLFITLLLVVVIAMVVFSFGSTTNEKDEKKAETEQLNNGTSISYTEQLEIKIEQMLLSISEVSKAEVMVVCETTEIYDYLTNTDETKADNGSSTIREEVAYEKNGSNSKPIIKTTKLPKVVGVWVVINPVSASTKLAITNSLKTVLNLDESCINILQER